MTTTITEATRLVPDIIPVSLSEDQRAALLAKRMHALSDPTRLRVLRILVEAPENTVNVRRLVALIGEVTQGTVSRHIQTLVHAGFLCCAEAREKARGVCHYYFVDRHA